MLQGPATRARLAMIESLLLSTTPIATFYGYQRLTGATGFFFERNGCCYLVTSQHVLLDEASGHRPDRIEFEVHIDDNNVAAVHVISLRLYRDGVSVWHVGDDAGGAVDMAAIPLDPACWPAGCRRAAFGPQHLVQSAPIEVGASVLIVGYPLGFHDTLHHLPIVRQGVVASSFGLRFQGVGYFLTDARTHRGASGAPVVMRIAHPTPAQAALPWQLLGIHSSRLDMGGRDRVEDEALGLNCAWYADMLTVIT